MVAHHPGTPVGLTNRVPRRTVLVLGSGGKYWDKQGGVQSLCEEKKVTIYWLGYYNKSFLNDFS